MPTAPCPSRTLPHAPPSTPGSPPDYKKDACLDDGGNGLFVMPPTAGVQRPVVIGITSYGQNCQDVVNGREPGKAGGWATFACACC